ncbi:DUF2950 domain-containing protein [Deltaproteobacteria bacterium Smac51]|nr:DUF2950 domain-containing protein [Deltaproteobacteria bacterium Smac51]
MKAVSVLAAEIFPGSMAVLSTAEAVSTEAAACAVVKEGHMFRNSLWHRVLALLIVSAFIHPGAVLAQAVPSPAPQRFQSAESAVTALAQAVAKKDRAGLTAIFGPEAEALLGPGDDQAGNEEFEAFDRAFHEAHQLVKIGDYQALLIGLDSWPLPVPLAQDGGQWYFDVEAGLDELILRRIGRNELNAIEVCLAYFDAQRDYYQLNPEDSPRRHYARFLVSRPGHKDGLYWDVQKSGEPVSPLGELMALAAEQPESVPQKERQPYHGYYYKILTRQGPNAPGGAWDYIEEDQMDGGFGLLAYPAEYALSGVMSFVINQSGQIYEKDLGPQGFKAAAEMESFDPDSSWSRLRDIRVDQADANGQ